MRRTDQGRNGDEGQSGRIDGAHSGQGGKALSFDPIPLILGENVGHDVVPYRYFRIS